MQPTPFAWMLRDMTAERFFRLLSRTLGDKRAADHGTLEKRLVRREVTRRLGRSYDRLWR